MNDEYTRARFETLMLPLMNDAYNLARWLMKNQEDAEDMVQESYLKAFGFFASFHEGTNCRAWLLQIVRNTCYTALGARRLRQKEVPIEEENDQVEDPSPLPPGKAQILSTGSRLHGPRLPFDRRSVGLHKWPGSSGARL